MKTIFIFKTNLDIFLFYRLRAPSYFCDNETDLGLQLHYRSKRRGFTYYTMGQLKAIAQNFYNQKLEIEVLDTEIVFDTIHVAFQVLIGHYKLLIILQIILATLGNLKHGKSYPYKFITAEVR